MDVASSLVEVDHVVVDKERVQADCSHLDSSREEVDHDCRVDLDKVLEVLDCCCRMVSGPVLVELELKVSAWELELAMVRFQNMRDCRDLPELVCLCWFDVCYCSTKTMMILTCSLSFCHHMR